MWHLIMQARHPITIMWHAVVPAQHPVTAMWPAVMSMWHPIMLMWQAVTGAWWGTRQIPVMWGVACHARCRGQQRGDCWHQSCGKHFREGLNQTCPDSWTGVQVWVMGGWGCLSERVIWPCSGMAVLPAGKEGAGSIGSIGEAGISALWATVGLHDWPGCLPLQALPLNGPAVQRWPPSTGLPELSVGWVPPKSGQAYQPDQDRGRWGPSTNPRWRDRWAHLRREGVKSANEEAVARERSPGASHPHWDRSKENSLANGSGEDGGWAGETTASVREVDGGIGSSENNDVRDQCNLSCQSLASHHFHATWNWRGSNSCRTNMGLSSRLFWTPVFLQFQWSTQSRWESPINNGLVQYNTIMKTSLAPVSSIWPSSNALQAKKP